MGPEKPPEISRADRAFAWLGLAFSPVAIIIGLWAASEGGVPLRGSLPPAVSFVVAAGFALFTLRLGVVAHSLTVGMVTAGAQITAAAMFTCTTRPENIAIAVAFGVVAAAMTYFVRSY